MPNIYRPRLGFAGMLAAIVSFTLISTGLVQADLSTGPSRPAASNPLLAPAMTRSNSGGEKELWARFQQIPAPLFGGQPIRFTFTLDHSYSTSAGAFDPNTGRLIKTIWRNVRYPAGTFSATWDGTNDAGSPVAGGTYQIKVLYHNVKYVWDGKVGNTSSSFTGDHYWRTYFSLGSVGSLAVTGNTGYLTIGYVEQQARAKWFSLSDPSTPFDAVETLQEVKWSLVATDGVRYYLANTGDGSDAFSSTFVAAYNVADGKQSTFSAGSDVKTSSPNVTEFGTAIDISQKSTLNTASFDGSFVGTNLATGLAVQSSGNILAVAHGPLNTIRLYDKTSGAALGSISVNNPGSVAFDANGDLWVLTGTTAQRYTSVSSSPTVVATISGLSGPISIATHPSDANTILVADGGQSQQVKAFNANGNPVWAYGLQGGYAANGPTVRNDVFQFGGQAGLAVQSDGSFWIIDGGTNRVLHISAAGTYLAQIGFTPGCYCSTADDNNPSRTFVGFLEFDVDYSKPLKPGDPSAPGGNRCWTLVKNWAAGAPSRYWQNGYAWGFSGLSAVDTLVNGRTYGLVTDWSVQANGARQLVELTQNGLRETGMMLAPRSSIYPDGSIRWEGSSGGVQTIYKASLTGFDLNGNPQWGQPTVIASYPMNSQSPAVSEGQATGVEGYRFPTTSTGVTVSLNSSTPYNPGDFGANTAGMHLGGVRQGATNWLWQASPSVGTSSRPFDEKCSFDYGDGISYAANNVMACGRSIVYGFSGEFWYQAEADQFMHFFDDGLVVAQFGTSGDTTSPAGYGVAGMGGNSLNPVLVNNHGETYLYVSDEAEHGGLHRWHLVNAYTIREMSGTAQLGGSVTLNPPSAPFPTGLRVTPGEGQVTVTWQPISWATSYKVKYSTQSGGPYTAIPVKGTSFAVTGLNDHQNYYFAVSPMMGAQEYANSDEASAFPADITSPVHPAGQVDTSHRNYSVYPIDTSAQYPLQLETSTNILGSINQTNLGHGGYCIFDYPTVGAKLSHLPTGASIMVGPGWTSDPAKAWEGALFRVNGVNGPLNALVSDPNGITTTSQDLTISVDPGDTQWHYLTLFSPPTFSNARIFQVVVTPKGQASPSAVESVNDPINRGSMHVLQFLIKGPVTVTVPAGALDATMQAIFLDPADGS